MFALPQTRLPRSRRAPADIDAMLNPAVNEAARRAELDAAQIRPIDIPELRNLRIAGIWAFRYSGRHIRRRLDRPRGHDTNDLHPWPLLIISKMKPRVVIVSLLWVLAVVVVVTTTTFATRDPAPLVSIDFTGYRVDTEGIWVRYAATNRSRFDYWIEVGTEPWVTTGVLGSRPGLLLAGRVEASELYSKGQDEPYRLVLRAYRLPVVPPGWWRSPSVAYKCLSRFARGETRFDLIFVTGMVPSTNVAFTIYSPTISPLERYTAPPR